MSPQELKNKLELKFKLLSFTDLADLTINYTIAYKFLKKLHKTEFQQDERIAFYTSQPIPEDFLQHLIEILEFVDIDNKFILICSPKKSDYIDYKKFHYLKINLTPTNVFKDNYILPKTICAVPWNNIEVRQDGSISPCCMSNLILGNVKHNTLTQAFTSQRLINLRNELIAGKTPSTCNYCWKKEKQGVTSMRQHNIKRLKHLFLSETFDNPAIQSLDIKFQNTCNFKCIICNPTWSSAHAQEKSKYLGVPIVPHDSWSESEQFLRQVDNQLTSLGNIDMYGGEPFLIKNFSGILRSAIDKGVAKNIRLHYNSNGSIWPEKFINEWQHFKEVDIHFSIDGINERFNYQRGPSWEIVNQNILNLKKLNFSNLNISIMLSISILNIYYVDEVLEWANHNNFPIFVNYVTEPAAFALSELTDDAKIIITKKYKDYFWDEMQKILKSINSIPASTGESFCKKIRWYDDIRNTNFSTYHKEIADAMGYVK